MTRLIVGPFNRVEGDLEVQLEVADDRVTSARVNAPMYRGFEQMLPGKDPLDALVIVPRICGICSISQSVAAARAIASLSAVEVPPNGVHATNLLLATENLADHLSHFYLFFMPDFAREAYAGRPWHAEVVRRFAAGAGEHARQAIAARQRWFTLVGTLGGRWPHTHSVQPGGSARAIDAAERLRLLARVREFRGFLEARLFAAPLEAIAGLTDEAALRRWHAEDPLGGDLRCFLTLTQDLRLDGLGRGPGRYLSYGSHPQPDGSAMLAGGLWHETHARLEALDLSQVHEDVSHSRYADANDTPPRHPSEGCTVPEADKIGAYSWNKAPRWGGQVVETGAIARQMVGGHALIRDVVARGGANVYSRVLSRLLELARVVPWMEAWLQAITPREPFCADLRLPDSGTAAGLTEAARGALGHWVTVRSGRIDNYQIVAPTSWNFSPRDDAGVPGALESALVGTPVRAGERTPVAVQHVVRSFDPCMVCTVH